MTKPYICDCGSHHTVPEIAKVNGKLVETGKYHCLYCDGLWND